MSRLRALLDLLFHRNAVEEELDAEVEAFYETIVDRHIARGVPEPEARRLARLEFGTSDHAKEEVRDSRAGALLASVLADVRYALRTMRRTPVFAVVTILTLALGIGANSTVFSLFARFVLRPPPVGDPATLLTLHTTYDHGQCCNSFTWPLFLDLREQSKSFSGLTAQYELLPASFGGRSEPERVWGQAVTANFFDVAQLPLAIGRGFSRDEEHLEVVVLGHALWQRRFGADPAIVGKTVRLSGRPFTVVGVAPPSFRGLDIILNGQFWIPLGVLDELLPNTANLAARNYHWIQVAGRLRPGITPAQAAAELDVLAQRFARAHPESEKDAGFRFETAGSLPPRGRAAAMLFLAGLSAVALLVLCIACANVANLALAQAAARRRETAVRLALGATRVRLLRQMLTESLLLALAGGALGAVLALWAARSLAAFHFPAPVPLDIAVSVDWRVLLYTFALSAGVGLLFGFAPAWAASRPVIASTLKGEDRLARPGRLWNLRNVLVVAQIAMSLVLLCATGLFFRSLENASRIEIGFRSHGILKMSVDPRLHGYTPERTARFLDQLRERAAALPDVLSAACTDAVPLMGGHRSDGFDVPGHPNTPGATPIVELYMASSGYFETLGIPRLAGRDFADEGPAVPRVAVVNELFAQRLFGRESPIGRYVRDGDRTYQVIGVVGNIRSRTLGEEFRPVLFRALAQDLGADPSFVGYTVLVRYTGDPAPLAAALRREIHALDPALAVYNSGTIEEHLRDALFLPRLAGTLFGIFGFLGLLLAAVGLYGVISYWVSRRTREIGIRLAIGARITEVQRLIIRQGMTLTLVALVPGLAGAWAFAKLFTGFLYGVPTHDAATFILVPLFLAAVALIACWIPSRRAARVDPSVTLRHE